MTAPDISESFASIGTDHKENAFVYVHLAYGRCGKLSVFVSFHDVVERYPLNAVTCVRNCVR